MKRLIVIALFVAALCGSLSAQAPDEVAGGTSDLHYSTAVPMTVHSKAHSKAPFNDRTFCRFFLEGVATGSVEELGLGVTAAWVPGRMGVYATYLSTDNYYIFNAGADLRLLRNPRNVDWHLYGGLSFSDNVGFDVGMRLSATRLYTNMDFSWLSFSVGRMRVNSITYTTVGLSVELVGLSALLLL